MGEEAVVVELGLFLVGPRPTLLFWLYIDLLPSDILDFCTFLAVDSFL